jgi:hypothetical protein
MASLAGQVLVSGSNIISLKAGGTILAGEVVAFNATGVSNTVEAATTAMQAAFGVALHDAVSGDYLAVATVGCIVNVTEGKGAAIDAGDYLMCSDVAGSVITATDAADQISGCVGIALEDIAANGSGKALIAPCIIVKGA